MQLEEAVLSSQIEGTQSTLDDITEVSNYVDAMMYGLERLKEPEDHRTNNLCG